VKVSKGRQWSIVDIHTPYAVHGLDKAMGLAPSRLSWVCFVLGLAGALFIAWLQFWTSAVSWPLNVGGKPWNSLPAYVPAIFEAMVFCGGVGSVIALFIVSGLYPGKQARIPDLRVTDDRFALVLEQGDAAFDVSAASALLGRLGAVEVREHIDKGEER
jgi:hypothetical protein